VCPAYSRFSTQAIDLDLAELPSTSFRRHPWEVSRARFFCGVLSRCHVLDRALRVLDVGAGDGWLLSQLLNELPSGSSGVGWDPNYDAGRVEFIRAQLHPAIQLVRDEPGDVFELLLLLDVLEHIEDDARFLAERVRKNLAPGGTVLVSVPTWQVLFTSHDVALGHHRRYRPAAVRCLLDRAGLEPIHSGGLFHSLLLPRSAQKLGELVRGRPEAAEPEGLEWRGGVLVTWGVERLLAADNALSDAFSRRGWGVPGLSYWALCRRAGDAHVSRERGP
jgi:SAM-dependent methyltransferase